MKRSLLAGVLALACLSVARADPLTMQYKSLLNGTTTTTLGVPFVPIGGFGSVYKFCLTHLTATVVTSTCTATINILDQGTTVYTAGPLTTLVEEWPSIDPFCIAAGDTMTFTNSPNTGAVNISYRGFSFGGLNP